MQISTVAEPTRPRILVVEDEAIIARDIAAILAEADFEVIGICSKGEDALLRASQSAPDLLLTDIKLQGSMDGIEVAARLRREQDIPAIFITAFSSGDLFERSKSAQPLGYLLKPVTPADLTRSVEVALYKHQMEARLRESEERYRTIFDNAGDAIFIHDRNGRFVEVNLVACSRLGYTRQDLLQMGPQDILPRNGAAPQPPSFDELAGRDLPAFETVHVAKDGSLIPVEITSRLIDYGDEPAVLSMVRDISERKRAEQIARQAERYRAVADLASGIAHNFNNLLQVVMGNANLSLMHLRSGSFSDLSRNLSEIVEHSLFGAETVRRLQGFAGIRKEDGAQPIEIIRIGELIDQAVEVTKPFCKDGAARNGNEIRISARHDPNCVVKGRKSDLFEVLVNLIKNAAEAMHESGEIRIDCRCDGDHVTVEVQDTGQGIAPQDMGRLFTPFFTTKVEAGAGLGLATSRRIVRDHDGEIYADSILGAGSTFTIRLPAAALIPPEASPPVQGETPSRSLRILLIDDVKAVLDSLKEGLETFGHTVYTALSGRDGLALLEERQVDVVICDLAMPHMNGWEVAKAVHALAQERNEPQPVFFILTGLGGSRREADEVALAAVTDVLEKPVKLTSLLDRIYQGLD